MEHFFEVIRGYWTRCECVVRVGIKSNSSLFSRLFNQPWTFFIRKRGVSACAFFVPGFHPGSTVIRNRIIRPSRNGDEVRKHALYEKSSERVGLPRFHLGLVLGGIFIKCFVFNMNSLEGLKMKIMLSNFISKVYNTK